MGCKEISGNWISWKKCEVKRCKVGNEFMTIHHARGWTSRSIRVDPDEKLGCFGNQIYDPRVTYQRLIYYHLRVYIALDSNYNRCTLLALYVFSAKNNLDFFLKPPRSKLNFNEIQNDVILHENKLFLFWCIN